jgi:Uma2 family endonuclease
MTATQEKRMTVEEYIQYELQSEVRHEYIDGQLIEMPGEKKINNKVATFLTAYFFSFMEEKGYSIYSHDLKVSIPGGSRFYYPDWLITRDDSTQAGPFSDYIDYNPELIVEVISKTSRTRDMVDKYLDYIKIPSLKYYLIIDPERRYVMVHSKSENGKWESEAYSEKTDVVPLPLLETELPLFIIYR